jgi:hypothetical protein
MYPTVPHSAHINLAVSAQLVSTSRRYCNNLPVLIFSVCFLSHSRLSSARGKRHNNIVSYRNHYLRSYKSRSWDQLFPEITGFNSAFLVNEFENQSCWHVTCGTEIRVTRRFLECLFFLLQMFNCSLVSLSLGPAKAYCQAAGCPIQCTATQLESVPGNAELKQYQLTAGHTLYL